MKKVLAAGIVAIILFAVGTAANADPVEKAARGIINVTTGWLEIPKVIYQDSVNENPLFGATFGLLHGAGCAIYRTGAGLIDIVTCPFKPYDEHIVPEYVF